MILIELDDLVSIVEGYRQRKYNEDMLAVKKYGGKYYFTMTTGDGAMGIGGISI